MPKERIYLLKYLDDEDYRRRILTQLNRGESRHAVARAICHGKRGEIRKKYWEGQEVPIFMKLLQLNWHSQALQMRKYSPIYSNKHAEPSWSSREMTRECHRAIRVKNAIPLVPPCAGATFWGKGHPRNLVVDYPKLYGSNKKWKQKYGYHRRSLSEIAMYRVKQLLWASLTLSNYNAKVGETYAIIKAFNKLTRIGMPETQYIVWKMYDLASTEFSNKASTHNETFYY